MLAGLLAAGIVGRVIHGTAHLHSSRRYFLTAKGIAEAARFLGFATPSDFVLAYPVSREWLTLLIRRMVAVTAVYRIADSLSPGTGSLRSRVEFHRRGRFDATITLHDAQRFSVVRQGDSLVPGTTRFPCWSSFADLSGAERSHYPLPRRRPRRPGGSRRGSCPTAVPPHRGGDGWQP